MRESDILDRIFGKEEDDPSAKYVLERLNVDGALSYFEWRNAGSSPSEAFKGVMREVLGVEPVRRPLP